MENISPNHDSSLSSGHQAPESDTPIDWRRYVRAGALATASAILATNVWSHSAAANHMPESEFGDDQVELPTELPSPTTPTPTNTSAAPENSFQYSFLSSPDFLNVDIGNVKQSPLYSRGKPNSINNSYRRSLNKVMNTFKSEGIDDVLVAGDLVEGHWGLDSFNTGTFGSANTNKQRIQAVKRAGKLYYSQWMERFTDRGLRPFAALGDHEIGDNPWRNVGGNRGWYHDFKQRTLPVWKNTFSKHILRNKFPNQPKGPAANTAYATKLHPEVLLVSLDAFKQTGNDVIAKVDNQQMRWFDKVMRKANKAGITWKIVQFHTPVIGPVRNVGSSGLMYQGGARSLLWRKLKQHKVNLVLNGEVHDITAHQPNNGDPVQISHGGLFAFGGTNYMVGKIVGNTMDIVMKRFTARVYKNHRMWQTDSAHLPPSRVDYNGKTRVVGSMVLNSNGQILERKGMLDVYKGEDK